MSPVPQIGSIKATHPRHTWNTSLQKLILLFFFFLHVNLGVAESRGVSCRPCLSRAEKNLEREICFMESAVPFQGQLESWGTPPSPPWPRSHRTYHPSQLQAAAGVTCTRNFLSCLENEVVGFPLISLGALHLETTWQFNLFTDMKHKTHTYTTCVITETLVALFLMTLSHY